VQLSRENMKVEDSGLLQDVEVSQNSGLSVIAYQALNILKRNSLSIYYGYYIGLYPSEG